MFCVFTIKAVLWSCGKLIDSYNGNTFYREFLMFIIVCLFVFVMAFCV